MPSLSAVYLAQGPRTKARARIVDYKGWILTDAEYQQFGYAVHTAVHLSRLFGSETEYVLLGDPTLPAAQINCITGTGKTPNAQLTVKEAELKWTRSEGAAAAAAAAAESEQASSGGDDVRQQHIQSAFVTNSYVTVRATRALRAGEELWIDYGRQYWEQMSLYCPHCLEYGADPDDQMLLCESPGCKRAWHQLCLQPCLIDVPDGPFFCDIHQQALRPSS